MVTWVNRTRLSSVSCSMWSLSGDTEWGNSVPSLLGAGAASPVQTKARGTLGSALMENVKFKEQIDLILLTIVIESWTT